nr:WD repeat containing protein 55 [Hymenolepis microstoma]
MWDDRVEGGLCFTIKPNTEEMDVDLLGINDLAVGGDHQGTLLAAVDSGCLVTYNIRRRRLELVSEPLGFSARSVCVVKDGKKVLLGTDEGLVMTYSWGEFGSNCDRFPVRTSRTRVDHRSGFKFFDDAGCPSVEKIVKFSEDIVVIATDDGAISPVHILPNQMLNCIGWHTAEGVSGIDASGGDCMTLALSPGHDPSESILASGLPLASSLKFWSLSHLAEEARSHLEEPTGKSASGRSAKAKVISISAEKERRSFLSGLMDINEDADDDNQNDGENASSDAVDSDSS